MNQPLISVVVPVYNVEQYLDRCVESIVNQTYTNLEIILVDDGSPDNCPTMCDEWAKKDARIQVVHKENAGLGMARNSGLAVAAGEFVCFIDSDDFVLPYAIETCLQEIEENNADTILYGRNDAYPDGRIVADRCNVTKHVYATEQIANQLLLELLEDGVGYGVSACSKMFNLHIIQKNNIRFRSEREVISEDTFFCLDYFSKAKKAVVIPERLYCYFKNENSLSRTFRTDRHTKNNVFLEKGIAHIGELGYPKKVMAYFVSRYHVFALAAMKHIVFSSLAWEEKKQELRKIYKDKHLRKTIVFPVLQRDPFTIAIFMIAIKMRVYWICDVFLKLKAKVR